MTYGLNVVEGVLTAKSALIHQGNDKTGNTVLLNRQKFLVDGKATMVPYVSGNAVRGQLRRRVMEDMLNMLDYRLDVSQSGERRLYHSLFTGGLLEDVKDDKYSNINLSFKRKIYELAPMMRLFGFAYGNQMIESIMKVGQMLPICKELNDFLPHQSDTSFYEFLSQMFQTRRDDIKSERAENENPTQMLVDYEVFIPGTKFYHKFMIEDATDVDMSAFAHALNLWRAYPTMGGKSSIGLGQLKLDYTDFGVSNEKYLAHIEEHKSEIIELLNKMGNSKYGKLG